jgi:hypothetical protein
MNGFQLKIKKKPGYNKIKFSVREGAKILFLSLFTVQITDNIIPSEDFLRAGLAVDLVTRLGVLATRLVNSD